MSELVSEFSRVALGDRVREPAEDPRELWVGEPLLDPSVEVAGPSEPRNPVSYGTAIKRRSVEPSSISLPSQRPQGNLW